MTAYEIVLGKLDDFIRKYYLRLLAKGVVLMLTFGLLLFVVITGIEHFLWLNGYGRMVLFGCLVMVMLVFFLIWVVMPVMYLVKLKRGLNKKEASYMIGKHFNEVNDRLVNVVDLSEHGLDNELLAAAIEQKAKRLKNVEFSRAVDYGKLLFLLKYLAVPLTVLILIYLTGNFASFYGSYDRVRNYDVAYTPPAPFEFVLLNKDLNFIEGDDIRIGLRTEGKIRPDKAVLSFAGKQYAMEVRGNEFEYSFNSLEESGHFYFEANGYRSKEYYLAVDKVPSIVDFFIDLIFPEYLNRVNESIEGTGNIVIPEGTLMEWNLKTENTDSVSFVIGLDRKNFLKEGHNFRFKRFVESSFEYQVATSNKNVFEHERLRYRVEVVKDRYPEIRVQMKEDSLVLNEADFSIQVSDDYSVDVVRLKYAIMGSNNEETYVLARPKKSISEINYRFPFNLDVKEGRQYEFYFEVVDNDVLRGGKVTKSRVFRPIRFSGNDLIDKKLYNYKSLVKGLDKRVSELGEKNRELEEMSNGNKFKDVLGNDDKRQVKELLVERRRQEEMIKRFAKSMQETMKYDSNDKRGELLKERLLRQEIEAKKNEELIKELEELADRIKKDDLQNRLENLAKGQKNSRRNLEQLVELTKRYYVTERASQLARVLDSLAEVQKGVASDENVRLSEEKQDSVNKKYQLINKDIEDLLKDNEGLNKPMKFNVDDIRNDIQHQLNEVKGSIKEMKNNAGGEKELDDENKTRKAIKSSGVKMNKLSEGIEQVGSQSTSASLAEDAEMLRQILDNLITFSFKQEGIYALVVNDGELSNKSGRAIKNQKELMELFRHVDDSLFALSLRQVEVAEFVNEQVVEVYYNLDKTLVSLADSRNYQASSYQQYVLTAANELSNFLVNILNNMQQSLSSGDGEGQGEENDFQLQDIIKAQQNLGQKAGGSNGNGKRKSPGKEGGTDESGKGSKKEGNGKEGNGGNNKGQGNAKEGNRGGDNGGQDSGNKGSGKSGLSEQEIQEVYEIYKEQELVRQRLEEQLMNMIKAEDRNLAKRIVKQMEDFQEALLNNGITSKTDGKLMNIQQQLLKLKNAALEQDESKERKSVTGVQVHHGINRDVKGERIDRNGIEILNRDAIPLQHNYKTKVQNYFDQKN